MIIIWNNVICAPIKRQSCKRKEDLEEKRKSKEKREKRRMEWLENKRRGRRISRQRTRNKEEEVIN